MMPKFTVIGYYPDNDQPYASCFEADDWEMAIHACRSEIEHELTVVAVLNGDIDVADDMHSVMDIGPFEEDDEE